MIDDMLRSELDRLVPSDSRRDWDEVVAGAGLRGGPRVRRWWATSAALAAVFALLAVSTPLGTALARGFDDSTVWLTGAPGTPASVSEQKAFKDADTRSWLRFPKGTQLRHLISRKIGETRVELLGFRSGSSALCLRLNVRGTSHSSTLQCAPLAELRRAGGPARTVMADQPVGRGDKIAWYGIDRFHSSNLQITAGIVTDAVKSVLIEDDRGRHEVAASANAFLYVAEQPEVGQRVKRIWARTDAGLVGIPLAPTPFGFGGGAPGVRAPAAPAVEREVTSGRVGWLERREERGEPLAVLLARTRASVLGRGEGRPNRQRTTVLFGRVLTPDPDRPVRIVATLNAHQPGGAPAVRGSTSSSCKLAGGRERWPRLRPVRRSKTAGYDLAREVAVRRTRDVVLHHSLHPPVVTSSPSCSYPSAGASSRSRCRASR